MNKFAAFCLSLLFFLSGAFVFAETIYVSPTGNDANPGTLKKPLASLQGARDKVRSLRQGNTKAKAMKVVVLGGDYFMTEPLRLSAEDGGTAEAPIVYTARKGDHPVFYGGFPISEFEKVNDSLWKASVPGGQTFEQLFVNGQRAIRAQYPNQGFYQPKAISETAIRQGEGRVADSATQKISLHPEQVSLLAKLSRKEIDEAVFTFYHNWDNTRKRPLRFSVQDSAVYITGHGMKPWNKLTPNTLFTIENVKSALDAPGEWYLDKAGVLFYHPRPGESLANVSCFAPYLEQFLIIQGTESQRVENLIFENLSFQISGYSMPPTGNEPMQAAAAIEATIMVDYASQIQFVNCEIAHTGSNGIWFRNACSEGKVEHCYLHDLGAGAVKIGPIQAPKQEVNLTKNITVNNNIFHSGGHVLPCAVALIIFNASDNILTHNDIGDFRYSGISVGWVWGYGSSPTKRNKIEFNHIHHLGWGVLSDMGGVYTLGLSEGTSVSNNLIHHIYSYTYGGWGLYTDEGSTGITMENNLVYACKSSGFHQHYGKNNVIRNNIFANQLRAQLEATRVEDHNSFTFTNNIIYYGKGFLVGNRWDKVNFTADYNCYWNTSGLTNKVAKMSFEEWQASGKDKNSVIADPTFVDPAHFDFQPKNHSVLKAINFKPFNYEKAGVYGNRDWKDKALFDPVLAQKFDQTVAELEEKAAK
ncbi:right-handed parallel beta-helix repeat-containing protein [Tellurirhabdus bombi]|uniref:right-handed parallel beta-helix repeat-containing protein n=1 Tax=Tellurirhabdus bombi TaxID=2907205 RepID=UPI001F1628D0|nr:right-handed parallel beta-helix repeat-containing protein [Tellurirhabdus bombi]